MHDVSVTADAKNAMGRSDRTAAIAFGRRYLTTKKIVFVVNNDRFFLTHRASWASALLASGAHITVIAQDTGYAEDIRDLGFDYIPLHFGRESISAKQAARTSVKIFFILLKLKPNAVFLVATAAYVLGWPVALFLPKTMFIRVITGAGRALERTGKRSPATAIVRSSLRLSSHLGNIFSLFQIQSNFENFVSSKLCTRDRSFVIRGTGIDTESWLPPDRTADHPIVILFAARLFREKGIYEFINLAKASAGDGLRFVVVGEPDDGVASSVKPDELRRWQDEKVVEYWGRHDDMKSVYRAADIFVLPSRHPEGTPRVLIEAAACGVVAIASDQPGCREVVVDGETGLIADLNEEGSFSAALEKLLSDPTYRANMAAKARLRAAETFSLDATLKPLYEALSIQNQRDSVGGGNS
jgi:glycosyltransferase involved in cell wall biosynthesis